ncbi:MAG: hypothetical protein IJ362_01065 [Oscillospiraceae bacterium]|nr:hypothetical protein [Oscillospiraceae bacterium]
MLIPIKAVQNIVHKAKNSFFIICTSHKQSFGIFEKLIRCIYTINEQEGLLSRFTINPLPAAVKSQQAKNLKQRQNQPIQPKLPRQPKQQNRPKPELQKRKVKVSAGKKLAQCWHILCALV